MSVKHVEQWGGRGGGEEEKERRRRRGGGGGGGEGGGEGEEEKEEEKEKEEAVISRCVSFQLLASVALDSTVFRSLPVWHELSRSGSGLTPQQLEVQKLAVFRVLVLLRVRVLL